MTMRKAERPQVNSESQRQLDKAADDIAHFNAQVQEVTAQRTSLIPESVPELEPQTQMSSREVKAFDAPYIKKIRSINSKEPFNEKYRKEHTHAWEYVKCIVENREIIGVEIETWTKAFAGDSADFWKVPVNKPIYIPRHLANQLSKCKYHRLHMDETQVSGSDGRGAYYGALVADHAVERISCRLASQGSF